MAHLCAVKEGNSNKESMEDEQSEEREETIRNWISIFWTNVLKKKKKTDSVKVNDFLDQLENQTFKDSDGCMGICCLEKLHYTW